MNSADITGVPDVSGFSRLLLLGICLPERQRGTPHVVDHVFGCCTVTIFCYKNQFLLHSLGYFVSYTYNFYTGDFVICIDRANIIQGMKHLQAYKFRIEPNGEQLRAMRRIAGTCRFVWNKALALQIAKHQQG